MSRGKRFSYLDAGGRPLSDPAEIVRIKELVIPPAWNDVWIWYRPTRLTDLAASEELDGVRVPACAMRLLDVGLFRIRNEQ